MTLLDIAASRAPSTDRKRAFTLAVTSGKGGVGKTNVAVNLAALLAARQRSVVLFDADMGLANADLLCGVKTRHTLAHVAAGLVMMQDIITPSPLGFSLIPGASGVAAMASLKETQRQSLLAQMDALNDAYDVLIFDTGAGIGREVLAFTAHSDHVLIVTTPEPPAMMDAYAVLKVLTRQAAEGQNAPQISMVVNQVKDAAEASSVHANIMSVSEKFLKTRVELAGFIPTDLMVPLSVRQRTPFSLAYPKCLAASAMQNLATHVDGLIASSQPIPFNGVPFFRRFLNWWS